MIKYLGIDIQFYSYVEYVGTFDLSITSTSDKAQLDSSFENVNLVEIDIPKNL